MDFGARGMEALSELGGSFSRGPGRSADGPVDRPLARPLGPMARRR